jgi:putative flippase GtrA
VVAALANVVFYSSWLHFTDLHPTVANFLSATMVALPTFVVNRRWSWNVQRSHSVKREVLPYYLFTVANVTISTTVAWFLAEAGASDPVLVLATVAVYATTWVLRFLFLDRILFAAPG